MSVNQPPPQQPQAGGMPPELAALLQQTMMGLGGEQEQAADDTIGGFFKEQGDPLPEGWHPPLALPEGHQGPPAGALRDPYREGDEFALLSSMPTEQLLRFQDQVVAMGLAADALPGEIDENTARAMRSMMAMGNRRGVRWTDVYQDLTTKFESGEFGPEPDPEPVLVRRDPAELALRARKKMEDDLGRDISDSELQAAAAVWSGFDLQSAQQQKEFESRDGTAMKNEVTLVDPESRFTQWFEEKYRPEMERRESLEQAGESRQFTMGQIGRIDQMIGGA